LKNREEGDIKKSSPGRSVIVQTADSNLIISKQKRILDNLYLEIIFLTSSPGK
jgi:hypothetical protein